MNRLLIILFSLCFSLNVYAQADEVDSIINRHITSLMEEDQITGVSIAIVDHGTPYIYYFGYTDKRKRTRVNSETIFELASITKVFTALLLAQEVDAKTLRLDDSAAANLPNPLHKDFTFRYITLRNLATHTASLPIRLPGFINTIPEALLYLQGWQPSTVVGTHWQYSNVSIGMLGVALEYHADQTYESMLHERILKPLGMNTTYINLSEDDEANLAQGYDVRNNAVGIDKNGLFPAAYAIKSTGHDMLIFLKAALGLPGTPPNILQAMHLTQTAFVNLPDKQQGLAWEIHSLRRPALLLIEPTNKEYARRKAQQIPTHEAYFDGSKLIDKTGTSYGARAYIAVVPEHKTGIVILMNRKNFKQDIVVVAREILLDLLRE